jgi:hypothetical protein
MRAARCRTRWRKTELTTVDNLCPLERENLGAARDCIHDLFMEHAMQQAPGYDKLGADLRRSCPRPAPWAC